MKLYKGHRREHGCQVIIDDGPTRHRLKLRLDLFNHSPTGFEWGYEGSGPAQLALALLADALGDDDRAVRLHQRFKRAVVARLARDPDWELSADAVIKLAAEIEAQT